MHKQGQACLQYDWDSRDTVPFSILPGGIPLRYNMGIGNSVVFLTGNPFLRNTVGNGLGDAPWLRLFLFSKPVLQ